MNILLTKYGMSIPISRKVEINPTHPSLTQPTGE